MLLLGVLQAQAAGAGPVVATDFDLLDQRVLTTSETSVTFSSLAATYGSTYQHLQIRYASKSDYGASWADSMRIRFNGDSGSNYAQHQLRGDGANVNAFAQTSTSSINYALLSGSANTYVFTSGVVDLLDPFESTKNTTVRIFDGALSNGTQVKLNSGLWMNTAALTSIEIASSNAANLVTGSRFSLYGIKAGA